MWTMASARAWPSRDEPNAAPPSLSPFVVVAPLVTSTNPKIVRPVLYGGLAKKSPKSRRVVAPSEMTTAKNETNPHGLGRVTAWMLTVTNVPVGTAMTEATATEHRAIEESAEARPSRAESSEPPRRSRRDETPSRDDESESERPKVKTIEVPTWEHAISLLVRSSAQAGSRRRSSGGGPRGDDRGNRGGGRGRRRSNES